MLNRAVFTDPPRPLTEREEWDARYEARRAARQSRNTFRTARGQYRRYRRRLDGRPYLDWPRWKAEYDKTYRTTGTPIPPGNNSPPSVY
ncbi:hypothetical protein FK268_15965 [Tsukamurella sputi]|uniref:Uncharacterized protein n=1 Tax=Tsukamurella sputi TaxID=2591848 RepID=A0A5C5RLZ2_9ACTN|nr:hypothetical protein [Tsukamurella sputi]TWS23750.1 hypothetical protein FK268_15965 [Tsukamurella sputi]